MSISVIEKIEIEASPERVAEIMFDPNSTIRWVGGIKEVREIKGVPIKVGSTHDRIAIYSGKEVEYVLEVKEYIPGKLVVMETTKSPFPMRLSYRLEEYANDHCIVEIIMEGSSDGFLMFLDRLSTIMVSEQLIGDLERLKDMVEGVSWQDK